MSHILLKHINQQSVVKPDSNYVKLFSNTDDKGLPYFMDSSGIPQKIGDDPQNFKYKEIIYS